MEENDKCNSEQTSSTNLLISEDTRNQISNIDYKKVFANTYPSHIKSEAFSDSILSQYYSEIDNIDMRIHDLSKQSIDHSFIKSILEKEIQHIKAGTNASSIQESKLFALEKLMEIFILELTSRSLSNVSDSSGWELNRDHVIQALKNTEYYDLFLNHINDS